MAPVIQLNPSAIEIAALILDRHGEDYLYWAQKSWTMLATAAELEKALNVLSDRDDAQCGA